MAEAPVERRLAAILAGEVVDYSRLLEDDEPDTLAALKSRHRNVLEPIVAEHQGRIFKFTFDGVLVEFGNTVDAVQCAVEFQQAMAAANKAGPKKRHVLLRIGIDWSDVIVDGGDLYGDGVNNAVLLEGMAKPGGIVVSASAHDGVKNKIKLNFEDLGIQTLTNNAQPVHAYRVAAMTRETYDLLGEVAALALIALLVWLLSQA
jgi:class 3 adenylate cyclase